MGEEAGAGYDYDHARVFFICKGKRSKRQRRPPPEVVIAAEGESSSSAADNGWRGGGGHVGAEEEEAASGCVTEEEQDMASCLMLLARGTRSEPSASSLVAVAAGKEEGKFRSRRPANAGAGEFVYECRTCGRCFPSFQALGGHRTSHKKPRLLPTPDETTPTVAEENRPTPQSPAADPTVLAIPAVLSRPPVHEAAMDTAIGGSKQQGQGRAHECGVCGAEFGSGQALGGHMRRHRPLVPASVGVVVSSGKEKSLLELDLNMPAVCDDEAETTSPAFGVKKMSSATASILFPAPLVDCLY